jgi:hypothetical protein
VNQEVSILQEYTRKEKYFPSSYFKQRCHFFKNREQEGKRSSVCGWQQWEGGGYKKNIQEGEYGGNKYSCMKMEKMRPVETIPGIERFGIKRTMEGMNSTMIYCKNFCKCHNVPIAQQLKKTFRNCYFLNFSPYDFPGIRI